MTITEKISGRLAQLKRDAQQRFAQFVRRVASGESATDREVDGIVRTLRDLDREPEAIGAAVALLHRRDDLVRTSKDVDAALADLRSLNGERAELDAERTRVLQALAEKAQDLERRAHHAHHRHQAALAAQMQLRDVEKELREVLGEQEVQAGLDVAERSRAAAVAAAAQLERDLATARRQVEDLVRTRESRRGEPAPGVNLTADIEQAELRVAHLEQRLAAAQERQQHAEANLVKAQEAAAIS